MTPSFSIKTTKEKILLLLLVLLCFKISPFLHSLGERETKWGSKAKKNKNYHRETFSGLRIWQFQRFPRIILTESEPAALCLTLTLTASHVSMPGSPAGRPGNMVCHSGKLLKGWVTPFTPFLSVCRHSLTWVPSSTPWVWCQHSPQRISLWDSMASWAKLTVASLHSQKHQCVCPYYLTKLLRAGLCDLPLDFLLAPGEQ